MNEQPGPVEPGYLNSKIIPLKWKIGLFTVIILLVTVLLIGYVALAELEKSYIEQVVSDAEERFIRSEFALDYAARRLQEDTRFLTESGLVNAKLTSAWDGGQRRWNAQLFNTALTDQRYSPNPVERNSVPYWIGIVGNWFSKWISEKTGYLNIRYLRLNEARQWEELIRVSLPPRTVPDHEIAQPDVHPPPPSTETAYPVVESMDWLGPELDRELQDGRSLLSPIWQLKTDAGEIAAIPVITAVAPVFRPDDSALFGIIAIDMSLKTLVDNLIEHNDSSGAETGSTWRAVTAEDGSYLASSGGPSTRHRTIDEDFPHGLPKRAPIIIDSARTWMAK
ncbi:MAG: hypothetical protein R3F37_15775 [Candidatus Competibacteraceae bacterium]